MAAPRSSPSAARLGAASLVALGLAVVVIGLATGGPRLRTTAFAFLSTDPRPSITAHNSPAAARRPGDPSTMVVADKLDSPDIGCTVTLSTNGGTDWDAADLVAPAGSACFWPDPAFAGDGTLLVLYTAMGDNFNDSNGVFLQRYAEGRPSGAPTRVAGPRSFHARLATAGDTVLATWLSVPDAVPFQAGSAATSKVVLAVSTDGGRSFGDPVTVSRPGELLVQPTVVVGTGGEVVVGALDLGADVLDFESRHEGQAGAPYDGRWHVVTYTSSDGGATFGPGAVVADVVPPQRIYPDVGSPAPGFAVDPRRGRMYATWDSGRGDGRDVFLARSEDAGRSWDRPTQFVRESSQTLPAVAVAPGGRVDLLFYDRSRDPTDVQTEPVLASSWDGGRTFTSRSVSNRTFDSRIGFGSLQGLASLGQQLAVLSEDGRAVAFWSDTRKGTIDDNNQELAVALVDVDRRGSRRWPLVVGGALVVAAGAVVAAWGGRQPSARPKRR